MRTPARLGTFARFALVAIACASLQPASARAAEAPAHDADHFLREARPDTVPSDEELEAAGARIGSIVLIGQDVFDTDDPREDNFLFRLANRLHIQTKQRVIRRELLFEPGDAYSGRLLAESERLLRALPFLYDARIIPIRYERNRVAVKVTTRDVWTLQIGVGFSRKGGENTVRVGGQDSNFLGLGKDLKIERSDDVDRVSYLYRYIDPNLFGTRAQMQLRYQDNSDGFLRRLDLGRPFFSLETRWSAQFRFFQFDRVDKLYSLGEIRDRFRHEEERYEVRTGYSDGLIEGRTRRWSTGITYRRHRFSPAEGFDPPAELPGDRTLVYPWVEFSSVEESFARLRNLDNIERTEDLNFGARLGVRVGWSSRGLGADRDQAVFRLRVENGYTPGRTGILLTDVHAGGRWGSGGTEDVLVGGSLRYFVRNLRRHQFYVLADVALANRLDSEQQLLIGGDSGLRGYPLRYQEGNRRFLLTLEQRFYTRWYLFRLARVGGAIFVDAGRAWFTGERGDAAELGLLKNVGFGLRLESTRASTGKMVHLDVAFPLDGDDSIDSVQLLVTTRERF